MLKNKFNPTPLILDILERLGIIDADEEFASFQANHAKDICYLCNQKYNTFNYITPCIHWLLRPNGINKDCIHVMLKRFGCFKARAYLRWLANTQKFAKYINDLSGEGDSEKIIQETIKYGDLEWSFSCSKGDLVGHTNSRHGQNPHFHFQMRIRKQPFINYGDFHLDFSDYDMFTLDVRARKISNLKYIDGYGGGMEELMTQFEEKQPIDKMRRTEEMADAQFRVQTFVEADEGHTISGDDVYRLQEESKKTGKTMTELLETLPNVKVRRIVMPIDDVPLKAGRSKRKSR